MENFKLLKQGAEARLYEGFYLGKPTIAKERFTKKYRHPELDLHLTLERMRAEMRAIVRCKMIGIDVPTLYAGDFQKHIIYMEYFPKSITAKEFIFHANEDNVVKLCKILGAKLALMHRNNIVHGDLTTSNILVMNESGSDFYSNCKLKLIFIDFGLAHINASAEDKGVDLYVLKRALVSTHHIADNIFPIILTSYKINYKTGSKEVLNKYEEVQARGRKRTMVG